MLVLIAGCSCHGLEQCSMIMDLHSSFNHVQLITSVTSTAHINPVPCFHLPSLSYNGFPGILWKSFMRGLLTNIEPTLSLRLT